MLSILIVKNLYLIIILPLLASLLVMSFPKEKFSIFCTKVSSAAALFATCVAFIHCLKTPHFVLENAIKWFNPGYSNVAVEIGIVVDGISSLLSFLISCIYFGAFVFLLNKFRHGENIYKSCVFLNFAAFMALGFVLSSNLIQTIVFGMILSIVVFLFLTEKKKLDAGKKTFAINFVSDLILLFGAATLIYHAYNFDITQGIGLLSFVNVDFWTTVILDLSKSFILSTISAIFLLGMILKIFNLFYAFLKKKKLSTFVFAIFIAACIAAQLGIRLLPLYRLSETNTKLLALLICFAVVVAYFIFHFCGKYFAKLFYAITDVLYFLDKRLTDFMENVFAKSINLMSNCLSKTQNVSIKYCLLHIATIVILLFIVLILIYQRVMKV